jgi:hypothetical protein
MFQVKLMRPRQQGSKNLLKWAAFYQILCDWKRLYTVFPDDHVVNQPEQEPAVRNISSSLWDTSTITSTSPAEKYDYSITFPSLALYGSSAATLQPRAPVFTQGRLHMKGDGERIGVFDEMNDNALINEFTEGRSTVHVAGTST